MASRLHNLAHRGLLIVLIAFLAWPCAACEGPALPCTPSDATQASLEPAHQEPCSAATDKCHDRSCGCPCLSDTDKVRGDRSLCIPIVPAAVQIPISLTRPEPDIMRVGHAERIVSLPPLLVRPAVPDRAPPAV